MGSTRPQSAVPGRHRSKFPGGNFYPADASKEEIEAWEKSLPDVARHLADGFYSVIRRNAAGKLTIVPYHVEYQPELMRAAKLLEDAAALTANDSLKTFLNCARTSLLNDDYYQSEVAWMNLDSVVDPTIGPYEVYEDDWFNAKAAFEAFINVRDNVESDKLTKFAGQLQDIENHLPIEDKYKNPKLGALAPIAVVNVVYTSGDANKAVQTAAYNLPNDERVTAEKGTKRVMLKNVQEAKFRTVLLPIAKLSLDAADQKKVAFDAFFTHILMHELMHGLGPHTFDKGGKSTTVREQLKETYSAIEEAKADATGMFALQYLIDHGQIDKAMEQTIYVTFLASGFRTLRFGLAEAHGKGMAIQLNTLLDNGAFKIEKDGTFSVDASKVKAGVEALTHELLTVEAEGSCDKALQMLKERAVIRPEVQKVLDKMKNIPIDIEPRYTTTF